MWHVIENRGAVPLEALFIMGASAKEDSTTCIGMFGTGFKYALAVLMRNGVEVVVTSGNRKITFEKASVEMRDERFEQIVIREGRRKVATSLVTALGRNWDLQMAVREVVSNALDERAPLVMQLPAANAVAGYTRVYIRCCPQVDEIFSHLSDIFLHFRKKDLLYDFGMMRVYKRSGEKARCYRRGVLVYEEREDTPALYDYDFNDLYLQDDRKITKQI